MGKFYDAIPSSLIPWLAAQPIFFVATAPLAGGSVNTSPKSREQDGIPLIQIVDEHRVCYLDLTGSGNETISHLRQDGNGRITIMWVNLTEGPPRIVRVFGKGTVHERMDPSSAFHELAPPEDRLPQGVRALIDIELHTCSTSCGYSIPVFSPISRARRTLAEWTEKRVSMPAADEHSDIVSNSLGSYWITTNTLSLDGLPGLKTFEACTDPNEKERLARQKREHDAFQAPHFESSKCRQAIATGWTSSAAQTSTATKPRGCIMTVALQRILQ
ncbi:hypothetical protein K437DRAFT_296974 [Tilletiaria anomala UBC 951]|uniref:Pyridoxamine 5'-phosphate oxidase putative domain-containing protein n=1 Tax=Tilletiaria anomala (strain ATCC 24038 / CBS 436.72 / UBC 951) TaxID=1037660 RepID=A0A066V0K0_TILAU|nr:uncharacterized protein K437DRAFT_296974 [Tilletiaria anomala UBC 951]KDN35242.1 hypothetical protein K437DRAFT_296974 [Tilletiaria anomala UBC 951]